MEIGQTCSKIWFFFIKSVIRNYSMPIFLSPNFLKCRLPNANRLTVIKPHIHSNVDGKVGLRQFDVDMSEMCTNGIRS